MADTSKKTTKKSGDKSSTTVTRITATDSRPSKKAVSSTTESKAKKKAASTKTTPAAPAKKSSKNPLRGLAGYFVGAWHELRQVRWPNRKATWQLTVAVLIFTAFFAVLVLLLDTLFKFLFEQVLA